MRGAAGAASSPWSILGITTFGSFMANVDATIVVVALPRMLVGLHTDLVTILWTSTGYLLVSTVLLLPVGRLSDLVGRKRLYIGGFLAFAAGSALCGLSASGAELVAFRLFQGAGAAILSAVATPLITEAFPAAQLGRALGINSVAWVLGSVVGPLAGGFLVSDVGWRSVFYVTVPFGLAAAALAVRILPEPAASRAGGAAERRRTGRPSLGGLIDPPGLAAFTVFLTSLLVALSEGLSWGWTSPPLLGLLLLAAAALAAFLVAETRAVRPLFALGLFRSVGFSSTQAVGLLASVAFYATTFLLTFYLQGVLGQSPLETGLLLIPLSLPQMVTAPLGGWLSDRIGYGPPVVCGVALLAAATWMLSGLGPTLVVDAVVVPLLLISVANGLYWPPLTSAAMKLAPRDRLGAVAGMFYTLRNLGFSLSLVLALVFAETSLPGTAAVRIFLGTHVQLGGSAIRALVVGIRTAFRFSTYFYLAALAAALPLLRRQ